MFCSHTQKRSSSPGCARVRMRACACMCVNACVVFSLLQYVLPSRPIFLRCVPTWAPHPLHRSRGRQPPLSSTPHVAFFAQGWTHSGVGAPQVLIYDLWLRI